MKEIKIKDTPFRRLLLAITGLFLILWIPVKCAVGKVDADAILLLQWFGGILILALYLIALFFIGLLTFLLIWGLTQTCNWILSKETCSVGDFHDKTISFFKNIKFVK